MNSSDRKQFLRSLKDYYDIYGTVSFLYQTQGTGKEVYQLRGSDFTCIFEYRTTEQFVSDAVDKMRRINQGETRV